MTTYTWKAKIVGYEDRRLKVDIGGSVSITLWIDADEKLRVGDAVTIKLQTHEDNLHLE